MPIEVNCPECQALLRIAEENIGRQTRCPSCSAVFTATEPMTLEAPSSPAGAPPVPPTPVPAMPPAAPIGADASNPYAPTFSDPNLAQQRSSDWDPRLITADEVLPKAWAIFKEHWLMACVAVLIVGVINIGMNLTQEGIIRVIANVANEPVVAIGAQFLLGIAFFLVQIWLKIGQAMVMLDIARGREINLGRVFSGGLFLVNSVLAMIIISLMIGAIGLVLIGIPAAVFGLAMQDAQAALLGGGVGAVIAIGPMLMVWLMFSQTQLLIIDRGLGAVDSLRASYEITSGNKTAIFLIFVVLMVIGSCAFIVGLLAFCIGIIPAMIGVGGFSALVMVVAYLSMTGQQMAIPQDFAGGPAI